jgi:hypothetical protein
MKRIGVTGAFFCLQFFLLCLSACAQPVHLYLGISKKTESFNIENIRNSQASPLDNIQINSSKLFSSANLYAEVRRNMANSFYLSGRTSFRYNHHYYKKLPKPGQVNQSIPEQRKFKMDAFVDIGKQFVLKKNFGLLLSIGLGCNNFVSKYDYTYNDTTEFGQPFNKNFKGNWTKFTPSLTLGVTKGKYFLSTDVMFTKDPTFENLTSVIVGFTLARRIMPWN